MKTRVVTIVLLATLILGGGVPGLAQESALRSPESWGAARHLRLPMPRLQGEAAVPWFPPERSGPGAVITVTTTDDELNSDGDCALREAIEAANLNGPVDACTPGSGDDTVIVPGGSYVLALPGANEDGNQTGDLDILDNLTLTGDGAEVTILDGNGLDRLLQIHTGRTATISALTVTGGLVIDDNGSGIDNRGTLSLSDAILRGNTVERLDEYWAAALANSALVQDATATVSNSLITDNTAPVGAGVLNAPWTNLTAELVLDHSTVSGNSALDAGGILHSYFGDAANCVSILTVTDSLVVGNSASEWGVGGGFDIVGWPQDNVLTFLTLERTTVRDNTAIGGERGQPPSGHGGGLYVYGSTVTVLDSTISGNSAIGVEPWSGGGGGMMLFDTNATIMNSTISGNEASGPQGTGGGIAVAAFLGAASLDLNNVTVAGNSASNGGGAIESSDVAGAGAPVVSFKNTLIAGNTAPENESCISFDYGYGTGEFTSLGHNLEDYDYCEFDEPSDWPNTDGLLGPLKDNGGPTWTHALRVGSPAVDAGNDAAAPPADQRGVPRPQAAASDIGAYEAEALHVAGIQLRYADWGGGRYMVRSLVQILDPGNERVQGARVTAEWTLPDGSTKVQRKLTDPRGLAPFWVGSMQTGEYELCVTNVEKPGYAYDPESNVETCDTVMVP